MTIIILGCFSLNLYSQFNLLDNYQMNPKFVVLNLIKKVKTIQGKHYFLSIHQGSGNQSLICASGKLGFGQSKNQIFKRF